MAVSLWHHVVSKHQESITQSHRIRPQKKGTSTTPLWKPKTSHHTLDVSAQWLLLILKLLNFSMTTILYGPKDDTVNLLVTECLLQVFLWFLVLFLLPGSMVKITFSWLAFKYFYSKAVLPHDWMLMRNGILQINPISLIWFQITN